jgi:hypothetical protein
VHERVTDWGRLLPSVLGLLGLLGTSFLYLASGLLAPLWAVVALVALWLALVVLALRWFRTRPWWVLALPFAGVAVWWLTLTLGEELLGWTG